MWSVTTQSKLVGLGIQTYQVSRISRETPAFWGHLPLTRRVTKISRISVLSTNKILINQRVISK